MATASYKWVFVSDGEGLVDEGLDPSLAGAWIGTDGNPFGSWQWSQPGIGSASANGAKASDSFGSTWSSIFLIDTAATVTSVQCTAWDSLTWATTNVSANGIRSRARFVDGSFVSILSGDIIDVSEKPVGGGTVTSHGAGTSRTVNGGSQAATSDAALQLQLSLTAVGTPNLDYDHDNVDITITYSLAGASFTARREFMFLNAVNRAANR